MTRSTPRIRLVARVAALSVAGGILLAPVATVGLDPAKATPPHPVTPTTRTVPLQSAGTATLRASGSSAADSAGPAPADAARGALSAQVPIADRLAVIGVTWPTGAVGADDTVQVRVRGAAGWSPWQDLEADSDEHAPDASTREGKRVASLSRGGTAPFVAEGSAVQARVLSVDTRLGTDLVLDVVDPGRSPADATVGAAPAGAAAAATTRPTIYSRARWGADESIRRADPGYGQVHVAFVHHTDGSNTYSRSDVPAILRGIYAFHVKGRGWNDIGYNFLVDRFGRTWEGRYGGVSKAVIGAHTLNYNSYSFGVSVMGTFTTVTPNTAIKTALANLIAWKFSLYGVTLPGITVAGDKRFARISGHRDANQTSCPGQRLYSALTEIRSRVRARLGTLPVTRITRDADGNRQPDVLAYPTPSGGSGAGPVTVFRTQSRTPVVTAYTTLGSGWNALVEPTVVPDLTGDGNADIVAQVPWTGRIRVYPGDGHGGISSDFAWSSSRWGNVTALPVGDVTGDGHADLLSIGSGGRFYLFPGDGAGHFPSHTLVASGWRGYRSVTVGPDRTNDGIPDITAVRPDGRLVWAPVLAGGKIGTQHSLGTGWGSLSPVLSAGDLDQDGNPDVLARESRGVMRTYYGNPDGTLSRWNRWGHGWSVLRSLSAGVDVTGDGIPDIVGVDPTRGSGTLRVYAGRTTRDLGPSFAATGLDGADWAQLAGDIDGDGYADILARVGDQLLVARGAAGLTFHTPVVVGPSGWGQMTLLAAVGDISYDGVPDLIAVRGNGRVDRYAFRRNFTYSAPLELEQGWGSLRGATGVGAWNDDANGDIVTLSADGTLSLWRGSGDAPLLDSVVLRRATPLTQLVGVGDYNGDGLPDIVGMDGAGRLWLYSSLSDGRLRRGAQPMTGGPGAGWTIG